MHDVTEAARIFSNDFAARLFAGRKGHGGAPVSYMQVSQADASNVIAAAFEMGAKFGREAATAANDGVDSSRGGEA